MKNRVDIRVWRGSVALVCGALIGAFGSGCPVQDTQAGLVGTSTCLTCHDGRSAPDRRGLLDTLHAEVDCEVCHGPGAVHVRNGGRYGLFIQNPADLDFQKLADLCAQCHEKNDSGYRDTLHFRSQGASCIDCHDVHNKGGFSFTTENSPVIKHAGYKQLCSKCHEQQVDDYARSEHATQDFLTCGVCHDMHTPGNFVRPVEDNSLCLACHSVAGIGFTTIEEINTHTGVFHPVTPAENGASRCVGCHLPPRTPNDGGMGPSSHTLHPVPPSVSIDAIDLGIEPIPPNSCAGVTGCHDADVPGSGSARDETDRALDVTLQRLFESIGELP